MSAEDVAGMLRELAGYWVENEAAQETAGPERRAAAEEFAQSLERQADEFDFGALTQGLTR